MSRGLIKGVPWAASPAAGRCMSGRPFLLEGRIAYVEERFASPDGLQFDGLYIRFAGKCAPGQTGSLDTTVGGLERRIADGQVQFLQSAKAFNANCEWPLDCVDTAPTLGNRYMAAPKARNPARWPGLPDLIIADDVIIREAGPMMPVRNKTPRPPRSERRPPVNPERAALSILASNPWTFITEVCDHLWANWQPEWGRRPSYSTVRRWVQKSRANIPASPHVVRLDRWPGRK